MKTTRRSVIKAIGKTCAAIAGLITTRKPRAKKVQWVQLKDEPVSEGDFWASQDPNTPVRQGVCGYNLQMQAVHPDNFGKPACQIGIGNGAFWRPVGLVDC